MLRRGEGLQADPHRVAGAGGQAEYGILLVGENPAGLGSGRLRHGSTLDPDDNDLVGAVEALLHGLGDA